MPEYIVVNKRGMIIRGTDNMQMASGNRSNAAYHFVDFEKQRNDFFWLPYILGRLHDLSKVQSFLFPDYTAYFNADLADISFNGFVKGQIEEICRKGDIPMPEMPY